MKSREHDTVKEIDLAAASGIVSAIIDDESIRAPRLRCELCARHYGSGPCDEAKPVNSPHRIRDIKGGHRK